MKKRKRTLADDLFGLSTRKSSVNSKVKGNRGELMACKLLTAWTGQKFNRVPQSGGLGWRSDARIAGDIVAPIDFNFPFVVEVKNYNKLNLTDAEKIKSTIIKRFWSQVLRDADKVAKIPLLLVKENGNKDFYLFTEFTNLNGLKPDLILRFDDGTGIMMRNFEKLIGAVSFNDFRSNFDNKK